MVANLDVIFACLLLVPCLAQLAFFDLIHCDLWTLPVIGISSFKYYLVILDYCSHYLWTFLLRLKSDTFSVLSNFFTYVSTLLGCTIKSVQCDNRREFNNASSRTFFLSHGLLLRMSCPYTYHHNGKVERIICSANNVLGRDTSHRHLSRQLTPHQDSPCLVSIHRSLRLYAIL
jgi:hypothetical protein